MGKGSKPRRRPMSRTEMAVRSPVWGALKADPMAAGAVSELVVGARMALHRITTGDCQDDDPDSLASCVNVSLMLCEFAVEPGRDVDYGQSHIEEVRAAGDALVRAQQRANAGASFAFTGPELESVRVMLDLFEQQVQVVPHREVLQALATAAARIRQGQVIRAEWSPGRAPSERQLA